MSNAQGAALRVRFVPPPAWPRSSRLGQLARTTRRVVLCLLQHLLIDNSSVLLQVHVDRTSKELPAKPTTRSRAPSGQAVASTTAAPQPPSSTGTGIGRLTIGTGARSGAAAAPVAGTAAGRAHRPARVATAARAPTQPAAVAPAAPKIEQGEWAGAYAGPSHAVPQIKTEHGAAPNVGLGIGGVGAGEWDHDMAVDPQDAQHGVKRAHEVDHEFDEDDEDEPAAAFGGGHAHPHGAAAHEDKVRVLAADAADEDGTGRGAMELDPDDWLLALCDPDEADESERVLEILKREFKEEVDWWDISMVAEYSDEIFKYMSELEVRFLAVAVLLGPTWAWGERGLPQAAASSLWIVK